MTDSIDYFAYDEMVEDALRGVLRQALDITARQGLPGAHHFYITFLSRHPDVHMAPALKSQHPDSMTIVLQNQFWDLEVEESRFSVTLSFGGRRERLTVPFAAITAFADPHATFGLQFQSPLDDEDEDEDDEDDGPGRLSAWQGGEDDALGDGAELRSFPFMENDDGDDPDASGDAVGDPFSPPGRRPADRGDGNGDGKTDSDTASAGDGSQDGTPKPDNVVTLDRFRKKP